MRWGDSNLADAAFQHFPACPPHGADRGHQTLQVDRTRDLRSTCLNRTLLPPGPQPAPGPSPPWTVAPLAPPIDLAAEPLSSQSTLLWASSGPRPLTGQGSHGTRGHPAAVVCKALGWGLTPPQLSRGMDGGGRLGWLWRGCAGCSPHRCMRPLAVQGRAGWGAEHGDPQPPSVPLPQARVCQDQDVLGPGSLHAILRLTSSLISSPSDPAAGPVVPPPGSVPNLDPCPLHSHSTSITWTSALATSGSLGSFPAPLGPASTTADSQQRDLSVPSL